LITEIWVATESDIYNTDSSKGGPLAPGASIQVNAYMKIGDAVAPGTYSASITITAKA
jgi:hypothetical protein